MNNIKCPACGIGNQLDASNCVMCGCELPAQAFVSPQTPAFNNSFQTESVIQNYQSQPNIPPVSFQPSPAPNYQNNQNYGQNHRQNFGRNFGQNYRNNSAHGNYGRNYTPQNLKSGLAIASLILGALGFVTSIFLIGLVLAPIGLILGIVALVKVKRHPRIYGGKGIATGGIVMSSLVVVIFPMIAAIAIPNLLAARRAANEGGTIAGIKKIAAAEDQILAAAGICADLPELVSKNLIEPSFAGGQKFGYRYTISNLPAKGCEIYAVPTEPKGISATGSRSFYYSTEDKVLRASFKKGAVADKFDLPVGSSSSVSENQAPRKADSGGFLENTFPDKEKAARNLKIFQGAAVTYQATAGMGKCSTIAELEKNQLISRDLGDGVDGGYRFDLTTNCEVSATPISGGDTLKIDKFGNVN